jgi:hypothetical protein
VNTDSIYRNTDPEVRLLVRTVVKADVLSGMLMNKAALAFPAMSASVIMKIVVATTIHRRNISRIILMCWEWMRKAASHFFLPLIRRQIKLRLVLSLRIFLHLMC